MKVSTKTLAFLIIGVLAGAILASQTGRNYQAFPGIDEAPLSNRVTPSTSDGRWVRVTASWTEEVPAFITIVAGDGAAPPNCLTKPAGGQSYSCLIQVRLGQEVVFSVQSSNYKGGANCVILLSGESWGSKVPAGARVDNHAGHNGHAKCIRTVDR
jgi:hypothetical protein